MSHGTLDKILEQKKTCVGKLVNAFEALSLRLNPNYLTPRLFFLRKSWEMYNPLLQSSPAEGHGKVKWYSIYFYVSLLNKLAFWKKRGGGEVLFFFLDPTTFPLHRKCGKSSACRMCKKLGHNLLHLVLCLVFCSHAWRLPGEHI